MNHICTLFVAILLPHKDRKCSKASVILLSTPPVAILPPHNDPVSPVRRQSFPLHASCCCPSPSQCSQVYTAQTPILPLPSRLPLLLLTSLSAEIVPRTASGSRECGAGSGNAPFKSPINRGPFPARPARRPPNRGVLCGIVAESLFILASP